VRAAQQVVAIVGVRRACEVFGVAPATFYRRRYGPRHGPKPRRTHPRALSDAERTQVLEVCHSTRFVDVAPASIVATLLDDGISLASERTFYRVLSASGEVRERRNQLTHPPYVKPELLATKPNELWSWDITDLKGPVRWSRFKLYKILDVFSRYVVGWMVAHRESATLAERLIAETLAKQNIARDQLTLHADRGSSMRSRPVAYLLADLGVTKSHSRPHTSNDNPYSESAFKTLKYRQEFPDRFGCIEDARVFCRGFFDSYNTVHRHSGIAMMTPEMVHYGRAAEVRERRAKVLAEAFNAHPERFVAGMPEPRGVPQAVWINPPQLEAQEGGATLNS
jgi:putative transposase